MGVLDSTKFALLFSRMLTYSNVFHADNIVLNNLFGTVTGLGMGVVTFDWAQISAVTSPLITPWWACVNLFLGFLLFEWIVAPILYYTDVCRSLLVCTTCDTYAFDRYGRQATYP